MHCLELEAGIYLIWSSLCFHMRVNRDCIECEGFCNELILFSQFFLLPSVFNSNEWGFRYSKSSIY
jgi:hypothetical protein